MADLPISPLFNRAHDVATYSAKSLFKPNPQLDAATSNAIANGLPPIAVNPLLGQFLALQCRAIGAKSVLEIGTLGGYSGIWFASAGAKVTSIEIDPKHRDVAMQNTKGLDVDIILGAALDVLPKLAAEGRVFDFVFIDADWENQWAYFEWATKMTRPGGIIYVDNVVRELLESELVGAADSLVAKVGRVGTVDATLVPTVASYKEEGKDALAVFDGFLIAVVKAKA